MPSEPRIAILAPFAPPSVRGNAVTVARIARGLRERDLPVRVWDLSVAADDILQREVDAYRPTIVHAFHAFRAGPLAVRLAERCEVPLVVTLTGTDANHDLDRPGGAATTREVLAAAASITVFHASVAARVAQAVPLLEARLVVVPQAVRFDAVEHFDLAARWAVPPGCVLCVFPAGIRAIKQPRLPLRSLEPLAARRPDLRLLYAGPVLDPDEGEALRRELQGRPWAHHVGAVPHEQMASLLARADVVLNCSISEGGMANSVLEALALERAVLASDIAGNRSLIEPGVTGFLFRDEGDLEQGAARLAEDPVLRRKLGRAGRALVSRLYPPSREIEGYLDVYRKASSARARP